MLMSLLSLCSASTESTMPSVILLMSPIADTWLETSAYFLRKDLQHNNHNNNHSNHDVNACQPKLGMCGARHLQRVIRLWSEHGLVCNRWDAVVIGSHSAHSRPAEHSTPSQTLLIAYCL